MFIVHYFLSIFIFSTILGVNVGNLEIHIYLKGILKLKNNQEENPYLYHKQSDFVFRISLTQPLLGLKT